MLYLSRVRSLGDVADACAHDEHLSSESPVNIVARSGENQSGILFSWRNGETFVYVTLAIFIVDWLWAVIATSGAIHYDANRRDRRYRAFRNPIFAHRNGAADAHIYTRSHAIPSRDGC